MKYKKRTREQMEQQVIDYLKKNHGEAVQSKIQQKLGLNFHTMKEILLTLVNQKKIYIEGTSWGKIRLK